jgi:formiminotetrahydrofolate cyclodeaminase
VRDILAAFGRVSHTVGRNIAADLGTGVALLHAAGRSAQLMVRTNTSYFADSDHAKVVIDRCDEVLREIHMLRDDLQARAEALTR